MANKLDDSIYIARYVAVLEYMKAHKYATLEQTLTLLNIPLTSYYRGKELTRKVGASLAEKLHTKQEPVYTELTEPAMYLGTWFIPGTSYPITLKLRS